MKSPVSDRVLIIPMVSVVAAIALISLALTWEPESLKVLAATDEDGGNTPSSMSQAESLPVPRTSEAERPPQRDLHATIARLLGNDTPLSTAVQTFKAALLTYYGEQQGALLWEEPQRAIALIVPVDERVKQIALNMERWRWLPENLGDRYILVNIAGFELVLT